MQAILNQISTTHPLTLAATSAIEAEEAIAKKGEHPDGSKPVKVPKRVWRPRIRTVYKEPEDLLDTSSGLDWLFEDNGKVIIENHAAVPPRDGIIKYDPAKHAAEIDKNLQWRDCPEDIKPVLRDIINEFYDVFAAESMQNPTPSRPNSFLSCCPLLSRPLHLDRRYQCRLPRIMA
jgi:hypothetical protein